MGKALLLFDGMMASRSAYYMGLAIKREIVLVNDVKSLKRELRNPEKYAVLLVEPYLFKNAEMPAMLERTIEKTSSSGKLPVIVYSSQKEGAINTEFGLQRGKHYDSYVSKWGKDVVDRINEAVENLENILEAA